MLMVKSLVAMATEKLLLKTSGHQFLDGVEYMYRVGLSPDRLYIMETASGKFILQFHSRCDIRPFAVSIFFFFLNFFMPHICIFIFSMPYIHICGMKKMRKTT
ncbi:unnamed protein product [Gongylonema pulchrum]|uniref:Protein kinase domain-containing protein n=1 Tax=Gongylonema pulchrum TaxID=637853 RepID=A0A183DJB2_9BILA|nr:unnamed protein product [Gongylonema pulchrum]